LVDVDSHLFLGLFKSVRNQLGGNTADNRIGRYVSGDDRPCSQDGPVTNRHPREYEGPESCPYVVADNDRALAVGKFFRTGAHGEVKETGRDVFRVMISPGEEMAGIVQ
jgi:hypothetical protein